MKIRLRCFSTSTAVMLFLALIQQQHCQGSAVVHDKSEQEERVSPVCTSSNASSSSYSAFDDVSWAIKSDHLKYPYHQEQYDRFLQNCRKASPYCKGQEALRLYMNNHQPPSVYNFTQSGVSKTKTPAALWALLTEFYTRNQGQQVVEWPDSINPYHNLWDRHTEILRLDNVTLQGGGPQLQARISQAVQTILEGWTRQKLTPVSVYGIRLYRNQSILTPHVDRMPLVASCIINIDQDGVEEPWPLEIYDHKGQARNITMEPGDMVLYESHSVIHGRPFPLKGTLFANVFLHFEPVGGLVRGELGTNGNGAPHYIIPGSKWEEEWKRDNPNGWELLNNPMDAVAKGHIRTLQLMAKVRPQGLVEKDSNGWAPIHQAVRYGNLRIVKFLIEENGVSPNLQTGLPDDGSKQQLLPIELALHLLGEDHEVTQYLWTVTQL
ncbi:Ankyrin Repeat [Seminavis robusta]|uniref:Ankyrin Repeat n=1 Tax=Seminavis robusta TaxID=568900 RepID=A0A9N8DET7_9STRA|nr:Ankyrin Repeat [Seminavis robusta]|eukprot:Sro107_g053700.1 Ankyrin Repeat (437) ;mRNA; r:6225-7643